MLVLQLIVLAAAIPHTTAEWTECAALMQATEHSGNELQRVSSSLAECTQHWLAGDVQQYANIIAGRLAELRHEVRLVPFPSPSPVGQTGYQTQDILEALLREDSEPPPSLEPYNELLVWGSRFCLRQQGNSSVRYSDDAPFVSSFCDSVSIEMQEALT